MSGDDMDMRRPERDDGQYKMVKPRLADKRIYPSQAIDPRYGGITLREHYAGLALQGLLAAGKYFTSTSHGAAAKTALHFADALIEQLEKPRV